jgi:hypothetical protein
VIARSRPVELLRTVTWAAATTAPEGSRTTPIIDPVGVWANAHFVSNKRKIPLLAIRSIRTSAKKESVDYRTAMLTSLRNRSMYCKLTATAVKNCRYGRFICHFRPQS